MAEDELKSLADESRAAAADVGDTASRLGAVWSSTRGRLAALGPAWGDDSLGHEFHDTGGYGSLHDAAIAWGFTSSGVLSDFASKLKQATDFFQEADEG